MTTPSNALKWLAIAAILGTGIIHVVEAPEAFEEATYKGLLFCANGLGALVSAYGIFTNKREMGWLLGLVIAAGSIVAYAVSRTVGLPGLPAEPDAWLEPTGVASLVCEGLFVILFAMASRQQTSKAS
jgi:hypothetical protein